MIIASNQKKSQYAVRRFGSRSDDPEGHGEKRRTQEDELTSLMFGSLRYMSGKFVGQLFSQLLNAADLKLPDEKWDRATLEFWGRYGSTEPDLVVRLSEGSKPCFTLFVEVKWNARQGQAQLQRYQKELRKHTNDGRGAVLNLVRHREEGRSATEKLDRALVRCLSWYAFNRLLQKFKDKKMASPPSAEERQWLTDHHRFLELLGLRTFVGFGGIELPRRLLYPKLMIHFKDSHGKTR